MRISEFTRPIINIEADTAEKQKQADAYPQTGHCRSGHRACSLALGYFLVRFLLSQISISFQSPIIIFPQGRKTHCPARDLIYIGSFRAFSTQLHTPDFACNALQILCKILLADRRRCAFLLSPFYRTDDQR